MLSWHTAADAAGAWPGSPVRQSPVEAAAAQARLQRQAAAEIAARQGCVEIGARADGGETGSHWSPGVYALLGREPEAGPLSRKQYIRRYVHRDDQHRVCIASARMLCGTAPADLQYRLIAQDGRTLRVTERLTLVASEGDTRLVFDDLQEVQPETSEKLRRLPSALRNWCTASGGTPSLQELIAIFDGLRDREQRRLTRDMHDDFGQLLAAMKIDLSTLEKHLAPSSRAVQEQMDNLNELVDTMIGSVRRIIAQLPPKAIEDLGLCGALEQLIESFRKRYPAKFTVTAMPEQVRLGPSLELSVYRLLQEALSNIARHAAASHVWIAAACSADSFSLRIEDDGRGASSDDLNKSGSFGVQWMRERVIGLNGMIDIDTRPGAGTLIHIRIPIAPQAGGA